MRIISLKRRQSAAGRIKQKSPIRRRVKGTPTVGYIAINVSIGPTKPAVPIPLPTGEEISPQTAAIGPRIALVKTGGNQQIGCLTRLGICSILVPTPCATRPPHLFSLKLMTAKPTICAQQPTTAAPAAIPLRLIATPMAAEEIGRVRHTPIIAATRIPIKIGCCWALTLMIPPSQVIKPLIGGPSKSPTILPDTIATSGVTMISTFVLPDTRLPISRATNAAINAPKGSPTAAKVVKEPLNILFLIICEAKAPIKPATPALIATRGGFFNLYATPKPIPKPIAILVIVPTALI